MNRLSSINADATLVQPGGSRPSLLQRQSAGGCKCGCKGGCSHNSRTGFLQRRSNDQDATSLEGPESIDQVLRSTGQPLDSATRASMEPRFGHDFSRVRVHSDTRASESAQAVNAHAYTVGSDIVFGHGKYAPQTENGSVLLAHELSHVVQQSRQTNKPQGDLIVSSAGDVAEREADVASAQVVRGQTVTGLTQVNQPTLHRQTADPPAATPAPAAAPTAAPAKPADTPKAPAKPPTIEGIFFGSNPQAIFDASLDSTECQLTLTKKIRFQFLDDPPAAGWGMGYSPWPKGKDKEFQDNFVSAATERWSYKHVLVPASPCPAETCQAFKVRVAVIPVESGEHTTMEVGYLTGNFPPPEMGVTPLGDTARLYSGETKPRTVDGFTQIPAEHEFGHMLGLRHVNAANCGPKTNDKKCYGETKEQMADIMGKGSEVSAADYAPFAFALSQFNKCTWNVKPAESKGLSAGAIAGIVLGSIAVTGLAALGIAAAAGAFNSKK